MRRLFGFAASVALVAALAPWGARADDDCNWSKYGHDLGNSFAAADGCSTISPLNASTLRPKWMVDAGTPVTASPTVVDGEVYVGSYGGTFYAINAESGHVDWTFQADDQSSNDYGKIVSSAAVSNAFDKKIVVFGGGATLYMLNAATGALLDSVCVDPTPNNCQAAGPVVEIESSPAIVKIGSETRIVFGMDFNEAPDVGRAGVISLKVAKVGSNLELQPVWKYDPETQQVYTSDPLHAGGTGRGCGNVWSSVSIERVHPGNGGLVFFGVGNCDQAGTPQTNPDFAHDGESINAIDLEDGHLVWRYAPRAADNDLDLDFGSSTQLLPEGRVGEGGKDGYYYGRLADNGIEAFRGHVASGSDIGGMIGSSAVGKVCSLLTGCKDAVFASSAIPFSTRDPEGSFRDILGNPGHALGLHAIDARTGAKLWDAAALPAYGAATYGNGVVFVSDTFGFQVQAYNADTGTLLWAFPVNGAPSSGAAIVGNSIYVGSGTTSGDLPIPGLDQIGGIWAFQTDLG